MSGKPSVHAESTSLIIDGEVFNSELSLSETDLITEIIQNEAIDPETARLREAVAELAKATEQGLKWMRKRRDMCLDGEVSLGLIALADDIDTADCALKDHAPLIAECKAEKEG